MGDEYFAFLEDCEDPRACSLLLRGASKDVLNEMERNLQDAMQVARNVVYNPRLLPGGGATEMAISQVRGPPRYAIRGSGHSQPRGSPAPAGARRCRQDHRRR